MKCKIVHELSGHGDCRTRPDVIDANSREDAFKKAQDMAVMLMIKNQTRGPFWPLTVKVVDVQELSA